MLPGSFETRDIGRAKKLHRTGHCYSRRICNTSRKRSMHGFLNAIAKHARKRTIFQSRGRYTGYGIVNVKAGPCFYCQQSGRIRVRVSLFNITSLMSRIDHNTDLSNFYT